VLGIPLAAVKLSIGGGFKRWAMHVCGLRVSFSFGARCWAGHKSAAVGSKGGDFRQPSNAPQGFGKRIEHSDIGTDALPAAILEVLGRPQYAAAASAISVKLRARKRTPVQEAAGAPARRPRVPNPKLKADKRKINRA
jgi:hypothetical protein